jgi:hypothetical protein
MEFSSQHKVKRHNFVSIEVVLFPGSVTDQVEEKFKEGSLVTVLILLVENAVENVHDSLDSVIQKYV